MNKILSIFSFILFLLVGIYTIGAQEIENQMTQGEFAIKLAKSLGLDTGLPETATVDDYIGRLKTKDIEPSGGFQPDKIITKEEKAELITKAFQLEVSAEAEEPKGIFTRDKAVIIKVEGSVDIKLSGKTEWIKAENGMQLSENDTIRTGANSLVDLNVGVASRVRIKEKTELLLKTLSTQADTSRETICLYLAMGEMLVDVNKVPEGSIFLTTTPTTTVGVRGTIYNVKVTETRTEIQ